MVPNALFKMPSPTFSENAGGQVPRVHSTYSEEKAAKALREYNAWMKSYGYAMNRLKTYNEPVLTGGAVREHDERAGHQTRAATTVRATAGRSTRGNHRRLMGSHPAHDDRRKCADKVLAVRSSNGRAGTQHAGQQSTWKPAAGSTRSETRSRAAEHERDANHRVMGVRA